MGGDLLSFSSCRMRFSCSASVRNAIEMAPVGPVLPCWLCGNLPFALGIDVSNKVCMGLSRDSIRKRMDYTFCAEDKDVCAEDNGPCAECESED